MFSDIDASKLGEFPVFSGLTQKELELLAQRVSFDTVPRTLTILEHGNEVQALWILARGQCEVFRPDANGKEQRLATLETGSVFGEMSFFDPAPHSASVRAISDVDVIWLTRRAFDDLEDSAPALTQKIATNTGRILSQRLRMMDDWICELLQRSESSEEHRQEWQSFRSKLYTEFDL